jgi:hypothetical protein
MPAREPVVRLSLGKTVALALALGLFFGWLAVWLIPWLERWGVRHHSAMNLPLVGFGLGVCLAFAVRRSQDARGFLALAFAPLTLGAIGWLAFGLPAGALLVFLGVSEDAADYAPTIGFAAGVGLGLWGWWYAFNWVRRRGGANP